MNDSVGQNQKRVDGREKVTGVAYFVADMKPGRLVYARVFRSSQSPARILQLDVERARKAHGVRAVVTGADCPDRIGHAMRDQYPIARSKVRYWGEPVAVVVADSEAAAEAALPLIEVEYEPLGVNLHPRQALQEGAPLIHEELGEYEHEHQLNPIAGTNICHHYSVRRGDVEKAFAEWICQGGGHNATGAYFIRPTDHSRSYRDSEGGDGITGLIRSISVGTNCRLPKPKICWRGEYYV